MIAGNTRLKAAQSLGITEVPVWWFDGSDLNAVACNVADNKLHSLSGCDDERWFKLLEHLRQEDALDGVGYSEDDIDALVQDLRRLGSRFATTGGDSIRIARTREPGSRG